MRIWAIAQDGTLADRLVEPFARSQLHQNLQESMQKASGQWPVPVQQTAARVLHTFVHLLPMLGARRQGLLKCSGRSA